MYRVGILGTENSHATKFTNIFNVPNAEGKFTYPDFKVTALYAHEKEPSEKIRELDPSITIVDSIEEMLPLVDCIMVTARHGKYHAEMALPFIEKGMPAFIDKPFTIDITEAEKVLAAGHANNAPICGGSGCKFAPQIVENLNTIQTGKYGVPTAGFIDFPGALEGDYGGVYFYGVHAVEMALFSFGMDVQAVTSHVNGNNLMSVLHYPQYDVVLNFATARNNQVITFYPKQTVYNLLDVSKIFDVECNMFVEMVRSGKSPMTDEQLINPVIVLNAIERSARQGRKVAISEFAE